MAETELEGWGTQMGPSKNVNLRQQVIAQNKKKKGTGGFQAMGLSKHVFNGILRRGYKVPTPIQRKTIPVILSGKDVVAMARTGSGKTAAFLIPLFEKLSIPTDKCGARALILSPTRELAVQTLKFAQELGKYSGLKCATALGGDSFDQQFSAMHGNPDIIIGTPGRFVHLCIEMNLSLDNIEYAVFDEADRLFEMGFFEQLREILGRLPSERQTLLFSATLPKLLVEFAQAGLTEPVLIRLDTETKVSDALTQVFFRVSSDNRMALLVHLLNNVVPRDGQTMIFAPTKHHVEYIHLLLENMKLVSTYLYSSLPAQLRKINIEKFRRSEVNLMVVTDIAARGIDIPLLDSVINFNFPSKPKLYVHRVGRVARAGRTGIAYSMVARDDIPYLIDLQLFFNKDIRVVSKNVISKKDEDPNMLLGCVPQFILDDNRDYIGKTAYLNPELDELDSKMTNALKKFTKCKELPSKASVRKSKDELWGNDVGFHPLLVKGKYAEDQVRLSGLLDTLKNVRCKTTIFDILKLGSNGPTAGAAANDEFKRLNSHRIEKFYKKRAETKERQRKNLMEKEMAEQQRLNLEVTTEGLLTDAFQASSAKSKCVSDVEQNCFIPYQSSDHYAEAGYAVSAFGSDSAKYTLDVTGDEEENLNDTKRHWDRTKKKFVTKLETKKIKTESGHWVAASYKSNRYQKWILGGKGLRAEVAEEGDDDDHPRHKGTNKYTKKFVMLNSVEKRQKTHPLLKGHEQKFSKTKEVPSIEVRKKIQKRKQKQRAFFKRRTELNAKLRARRGKQGASRVAASRPHK